MKNKSVMEKIHGRCTICGRINKPNHNVICGLVKPNKKRREYDKAQADRQRRYDAIVYEMQKSPIGF